MRYGVIADVHGNLHALSTVLEALESEGVERYLCAGDLVGFGPRPNECVERIASLDAVVVAGNHDLMAVGRLSTDTMGPYVRRTVEWTQGVLSAATRSYLAELPLTAATDDGIVVAHGSLDDPTEYVRSCAQMPALPDGSRGVVLGHTHVPLRCDGRPWLLNPGSVGQSRERRPVARAAVLDGERARILDLDYDVRATRAELRAAGLPVTMCHLKPGRLQNLRRRISVTK
jgi:predicted phosphodiesterase